MRYIIVALVLVFNIINFSYAYAKDVIIEAVGEYTIGDSESKLIGKQRAIDEAMRYASEKAGVYVESYSKTNMGMLTADEVKIISANILKLTKEPMIETVVTKAGDIHIIARVSVSINTNNIENIFSSILMERNELIEKNKLLEKEKIKNLQEINNLKKQFIENPNKEIENKIRLNEVNYEYLHKFNEAINADVKGEKLIAINLYTKAIELKPDSSEAFLNRGNLFNAIGKYDNAIDDCIKAIKFHNCDKIEYAYNNLGVAYYHKGEYNKAISNYNSAILINLKYSHAYSNRAIVYTKLGYTNQVINDCTTAIFYDLKNIVAYRTRGNMYGKIGEYNKAIEDYTSIINFNPRDYKAYEMRGNTYLLKGMYTEAIIDINNSLIYNSNNAELYFMRGMAYEELKKYSNAYLDYEKAAMLDPSRSIYFQCMKSIKNKI